MPKVVKTKKRAANSHSTADGTPVTRMYKNHVDLPDDAKKKIVQIMNVKLAAASDMYSQAKFAHWNVKGIHFYQLHLVFDNVADAIFKHIDPIAERITQLGGVANGTVRQAAGGSPIPPYNVNAISGPEHLEALIAALAAYCKELRDASDKIDDLKDEPTSDFFKRLVVEAEEELYFLESHLEAGEGAAQ
jgi:starvation-inducible DNA-binding protein